MSDHDNAHKLSQDLCDALFKELQALLPDLERSSSKKWCGIFKSGRKRLAYVNHRRTSSRLDVWCLGDLDELRKTETLEVRPRQPTIGGFRHFTARFFLDDPHEIREAAELLYRVSAQET